MKREREEEDGRHKEHSTMNTVHVHVLKQKYRQL